MKISKEKELFAKHISDNGLLFGIYKECLQPKDKTNNCENVLRKLKWKLELGSHEGRSLKYIPFIAACLVQQEKQRIPLCMATSCRHLTTATNLPCGQWEAVPTSLTSSQWEATNILNSRFLPMNTVHNNPSNLFLSLKDALLCSQDLPVVHHSFLLLSCNSSAITK